MSGDTADCQNWGVCLCVTVILWVEARDAAQHLYNAQDSTPPSLPPLQIIWLQVNSAEVEKPWDCVF